MIRATIAPLLFILVGFAGPAAALEFDVISTPTSAYTTGTTRFALDSFFEGQSEIDSLDDGVQSLSFSSDMMKLTVGVTWTTWSSPPYSETNTPEILYAGNSFGDVDSLVILLSDPTSTFGFELEPESVEYGPELFDIGFYDGETLVGTIDKWIDGNEGARLIAATTSTRQFSRIEIINVDGLSNGFALANLRYGPIVVPEPSAYVLAATSAVVLGVVSRRRTRRV